MILFPRTCPALFVLACIPAAALAQENAVDASPGSSSSEAGSAAIGPAPSEPQAPLDKRVFGVLPNYRTVNESTIYTPISTKQKFIIASKDSFDYPLVLLGAAVAGMGQLSNQNPSFDQGMVGYGRRFGTSYADQAIGNMMTEAIFPTFLREDPRYFRIGTGTVWSRTYYAATRIFVTRTDSGRKQFNFSEVLGNATAVAISNAYYPDGRSAADSVEKLAQQLGIDAVSQVLKEFWPDIKRKLFQRHKDTADFNTR
jgi:hypothetical protein